MEHRIDIDQGHPDLIGDMGEDYYDPDENKAPVNERRWSEEKLKEARQRLFEEGSEYLPTQRGEIVGIENVLSEIDDLIHWLQNAQAYSKWRARLEPGVIFEGPPGTGKTTVARYIATASGALFINVRDWPHNNPTFSDADIRDLFVMARATYRKTKRPIVLFWDEFETNAKERSSGSTTPEQAVAVSQLTIELDGIGGKNAGILLIGCTNYYYGIDNALKRPGRMGLHIEFNPPDRVGKRILLDYYLGKYRTKGEVDVDTLSYLFESDSTAAEIEEACMEAWRYAVKRTIKENGSRGRKRPLLIQKDLIPIFVKRLVGPPTSFITMDADDRYRIAIHETGHALAAVVWDIPLRIITVQPGKKALGKVMTAGVTEHIGTIAEMVSQMRVSVGSVVAEQEAGIPAALGAAGDIDQINEIASRLVDDLYAGRKTGLLKIGAISMVRHRSTVAISDLTLTDSDHDIREMLQNTYQDARAVMAAIGKARLNKIAKEVNRRITLTGQEFMEVVEKEIGDPLNYQPADRVPLTLNA